MSLVATVSVDLSGDLDSKRGGGVKAADSPCATLLDFGDVQLKEAVKPLNELLSEHTELLAMPGQPVESIAHAP